MIHSWLQKALGHTSPELSLVYVKNFRAYATDRHRLHSIGGCYQADGYYCPYTGAAVALDTPYPEVENVLYRQRIGSVVRELPVKRGDFVPARGRLLFADQGEYFNEQFIDDIFSLSGGIADGWYHDGKPGGPLHLIFNNGLAHAAVMPVIKE